ncbi:MAG: AAA family ATPase [Spirochaetales bacterium]|nr:AAA family ATPase [Spirochaetales bacterium]
MKRKTPLLLVLLVLAALLVLFSFDVFDFSTKTSFPEFSLLVEEGKVESIQIEGDTLKVKSEGKTLSVPNPDYPTFKKDMMEKGISVSDETTTLDDVLNTLFNVIFLALFVFAIYKALSWYSSTFHTVHHTGVHFSDIAGMNEVKKDMESIVKEMRDTKEGKKKIKGIILEGPPGNGKTLFARALAEESGVNFIATKGADFQGAVMGLGAMKVKMLFKKARNKKPCIIFIDEFDSIGEKRNYAGSGIDKENNRILTTLLNEMDGFSGGNGVLVVAATNSFQSLDPALIRPGRFDLKYTISNPDHKTRMELLKIYGKDKTFSSELTPEILSTVFDGLSSAAIESVLREAEEIRKAYNKETITIECIIASAGKCREKLNIKIKKN